MKQAFLFTIIFFALNVYAQEKGLVKGKIMEGDNPLEFVNVLLTAEKDTVTVIKFATTGQEGLFMFDNVPIGEYRISARLIGYTPKSISFTIKDEIPNVDFGNVFMETDTQILGIVTVEVQRKLIQKTTEGFIMNAAADITQTGGTVTDLLRNTPAVSVDAEGGITLRGKTPLILINGRNSAMSNTDHIAASSVESIEIITNPSAKYDASAESGIINIKLKKNTQSGTNGALAAGAGLGAKGRVNSTVLLNHKTEKWNFGIGYDNRFAGRTRNIEATRTNFHIPEEYQLNQNRSDKRLELLQDLKFNIDFSPDTKNLFSFEAIGNLSGQDNDESLNSSLYRQDNTLNSRWNRHSDIERERVRAAEFALNYERKFDDERKNLSAALTTSIERMRQNTDIVSHALDDNFLFIGNPYYGRTHNYEYANVANAVVNYVFPATSKSIIETGYKGILRLLDADYETSVKEGDDYIVDSRVSNIYKFKEQIHAAYLQYDGYIGEKDNPRWRYVFGIRAEQVLNNGETRVKETSFKNNYINFFPSVNLTYYANPEEFWKMSYGKRINYPSMGQLGPFIDITDSLNQHSGNPYLKPEIIHSFELGYNKSGRKYSITTMAYYRYSKDVIRTYYDLKPGGVILYFPKNFGSASSYGLDNIIYLNPASFYDATVSMSLFRLQFDGSGVERVETNYYFGWFCKIVNNFKWNKSKFQLTGNYNSPVATPQGKNIATYYLDFGFRQQTGKNSHLGVVVTDIFDTFQSGHKLNTPAFINTRNHKADTRAILFTFAYTFNSVFKEKLLENRFSREY